ncbi:MAG: hypothetical protein JO218_07870 [Burkholderiales bacterium]|nr:hypothetical protein [Burkholderiales bacterium]
MAGGKLSIWQILRRTVIALVVTLLVLVVLVIVINRFDEKLDPGAEAWLHPTLRTIPPETNGYYALLALSVEAPDAIKAGQAIDAEIAHEAGQHLAAPSNFDQIAARQGKLWQANLPSCKSDSKDCVADYYARESEFQAAIDAQKTALARYYAMVALPDYAGPYGRFSLMLSPASHLAQLARADAALRIKRGDTTAVAQLSQSLQFWTTVATHAQQLIEAMFAVGQIRQTNAVLASLLKLHPELKDAIRQGAKPALDTFTAIDVDKRLPELMHSELTYLSSAMEQPNVGNEAVPSGGLGNLLLVHNATINMLYHALSTKMTSEQVEAACNFGPRWVYNPAGRMILCIATPDYSRYGGRIQEVQKAARELSTQLQ